MRKKHLLLYFTTDMLRLIGFMVLFSGTVVAQTSFGVVGGLNVSDIVMTNYINPDVESELALKLGVHAGIFVRGTVTDRIGMAAELLYSDKGVKGAANIHLHYITLPLIIQYRLGDQLVAELGPEPGYLFSARSKHGDFTSTYNNKLDLALNGGVRLDTPRLIFRLRYSVGLLSVREPIEVLGPSGPEKVKYQNRVLQVSVGYKIFDLE